jgi:hypothetical protein
MSSVDSLLHNLAADGPVTRRTVPPQPPVEHSLRPRLTAIAPSVAEVVRSAGGWLFDQRMAGWDVNVLTTDHNDLRPLRILGARAHDLDTVLASPIVLGPCLRSIAASADLYDSDERVRQMVQNALEAGVAELRLWGDTQRARLLPLAGLVRHRPSIAACAFKVQALVAAGIPAAAAADVEVFSAPGCRVVA